MKTKTTNFSGTLQYKGASHIDLFAPRVSHQLPCYISWKLDLFRKRRHAFQRSWKYQKDYVFPTFLPNWKCVEESPNGPGPDLTGNSNLAKSLFVSTSSSDVKRKTNFDSTSKRSFKGPKDGKASINGERKIQISSLDNFREKLFAERIFKNPAEFVTSAKEQGLITHYKSAWGKWDSWCSTKQVGPISGPLSSVLDFLAELFHLGLKWSTIAGYRSSISAFHDSTEDFSVAKHPRVCSLLKGIFKKRAPIPRYTFLYGTFRKY